ncbi:MAG: glutamate racemase [candidate division Zixibacteria bacterium]|nr:glutamate racemase [candidate division Zixibacteria bacterium]
MTSTLSIKKDLQIKTKSAYSIIDANPINRPIGVFDSGIGGLTVVKEIFRQLPHEEVVYFGDTGRFPYGIRSSEVIRRFARQNINFLLEQNVKMVVVACNTASAHALDYVKQIYNIPIIGVIEPGAKAASAATSNKRIGVIGTEGTIASGSYTRALHKINPRFKVFGMACPLFVSLAEAGYIDKKATYLIAEEYLAPLKKKDIDTLVLGCTHYPPLKKTIGKVMGRKVRLIDSADETAKAVKNTLSEMGLASKRKSTPYHKYFVSDTPDRLETISKHFLDKVVKEAVKIDITAY